MPTDKMLPLSDHDFALWRRRLDLSRELRKARMTVWKDCVQAYLGKSLLTTPDHDVIVVNKEFPFLEQKKAQLVFQVPEVQLKPMMPGLETAVRLFQSVVNHELGPDGANVKDTLDEVIFDVLAMGIGPTKIGYAAVVGEREVQEPEIDPLTGQPKAVDPMTGQPATRTVKRPYLVHEDYFWRRISPTKFLLPHDFEGMNFDESPWLAFEFEKDLAFAREEYQLPSSFEGSRPESEESLSGEKEIVAGDIAKRKMCGIEIWYYAAQFDPKEPDPRKVRCLVLVDGYDKPVRHQDSPYQKMNAQGQLMGMHGLPLHVLTLRGVAGCAYPPSDIELSKHISDEASKGRTQMVLQRETSIPMRWALKTGMDPDTLNKVLKGHWQAVIPVDQDGNQVLGEVARAQFPRENFTFYEIADRDYEEMWALGRAQRGLTEDAMRTATELQMVSSAANVRLDSERTRVLTFFTRGARKFGALLQLFKTQTGYVEVLGDQQAQGLQAWNREAIQGEFVFQAKPDSALRMDAAVERKQALDLYNLTGRDPNVKRVELLKSLFTKFNMDPAQLVVEQLPAPPPEKPNVSINVKAEDLMFPSPVLIEVLKQYGIQVQPQPQGGPMPPGMPPPMPEGGMQPQHGGPQPEMPALNKHALRGTGEAPAGVAQRPGTVQ